jgi:hypothetical protein
MAVTSVVIESCLILWSKNFRFFVVSVISILLCLCDVVPSDLRFSLYPLLVSSSLADSWWILSRTTPLFGL